MITDDAVILFVWCALVAFFIYLLVWLFSHIRK